MQPSAVLLGNFDDNDYVWLSESLIVDFADDLAVPRGRNSLAEGGEKVYPSSGIDG